MKPHRIRRIAPVIPTASMADIAFLLIIFFMLTTTFSQERTTVDLPESEIRTEVPKDAAIIAITQEGIIRFTDGERPAFALGTAAELGPLTQEVRSISPQ